MPGRKIQDLKKQIGGKETTPKKTKHTPEEMGTLFDRATVGATHQTK